MNLFRKNHFKNENNFGRILIQTFSTQTCYCQKFPPPLCTWRGRGKDGMGKGRRRERGGGPRDAPRTGGGCGALRGPRPGPSSAAKIPGDSIPRHVGWLDSLHVGCGCFFYICEPAITQIYLCGWLCVLLDCFLQSHAIQTTVCTTRSTLLCAPTERVVGVEGEC